MFWMDRLLFAVTHAVFAVAATALAIWLSRLIGLRRR